MKRLFDILFSLILLILFMPLFAFISIYTFINLGRPIFFTQNRPGLHGKVFKMYKFRTMKNIKDKDGNLQPDYKRLTNFGRSMRRKSLDEIPEIWNVLKGDMSFVGPRPLLIKYQNLYNEEQKRRHNVKPGITGWAQINGRNAISWQEKFNLDLWYVDNQGFMLDIKILFITILKVISQDDISANNHETMPEFKGNDN